jgi:hypothetical protein
LIKPRWSDEKTAPNAKQEAFQFLQFGLVLGGQTEAIGQKLSALGPKHRSYGT